MYSYDVHHVLRRSYCSHSHHHKHSWPEETKAVAEPKSLGWSPRNAGIVNIDYWVLYRIFFFLIIKNEYICLVVCDLSEPGPVPDLLHVKDTNVKIEENMIM